jgi:hypothetical protein
LYTVSKSIRQRITLVKAFLGVALIDKILPSYSELSAWPVGRRAPNSKLSSERRAGETDENRGEKEEDRD